MEFRWLCRERRERRRRACQSRIFRRFCQVAQAAVTAGVDMDMQSGVYLNQLGCAVQEGQVSERVIDEAVRRILRLKFRKGLFERPYADEKLAAQVMLSRDNLETTPGATRKSLVLLKNENSLLPLGNENVREEFPVSELVLGVKCGSSDGFSGISANPALGRAADLLVKSGGAVLITEIPEFCGAEHILGIAPKTPRPGARFTD